MDAPTTKFSDEMTTIANNNPPALLFGVRINEDGPENGMQIEVGVATSLGQRSGQDMVRILASQKTVLLRLFQDAARRMGITEQQLHQAVDQTIATSMQNQAGQHPLGAPGTPPNPPASGG